MTGDRVLIFTSTKKMADSLTRSLRMEGWPALAIHGDKGQNERDWVLEQFKSGKSPLMVATDVAARGLDVKNICAVINYDFPNNIEVGLCLLVLYEFGFVLKLIFICIFIRIMYIALAERAEPEPKAQHIRSLPLTMLRKLMIW